MVSPFGADGFALLKAEVITKALRKGRPRGGAEDPENEAASINF